MKIALLIFADFPEGSGPPRRIHMLGKGLAELGHEVNIIVPQRFRAGPLYQEFDGLHVHWGTLTTASTWNRLSNRLAARRAALRLVRRFAYEGLDWLILSNPSLDGVPFLFTARRRGARVIATYDDLRARPRQPTLEDRVRLLWLESADKLIPRLTQMNLATSGFLERRVRSIAPRTQTLIFPPVVDLSLFRTQPEIAAAFRAKWKLGCSTVISYLGTYWHVEGVGNLLKTASQLAQAGEKFKLVISGAAHQGLDCDDVPRLVNELKLRDLVIQTGWLPTDDVVAGMSAADILVVPKLNDISNVAGMPAKLAEYMAMGRAVAASRIGDIPLYLTDHEDALLCEPGSPDALAECLQELIRDVPLRQKLAANARLTASKYFDFRSVAARLESAMLEASQQ